MLKAKNIGIILDKDVSIEAMLKNGMVVNVDCTFIEADYDRLYLKYPEDKEHLKQYFYENKTVNVQLNTIDGHREYLAKIIYPPNDNLFIVEYYPAKNKPQKRNFLRVRATKPIELKIQNNLIKMLTIDISGGGFKILSPEKIEENIVVDSYLRLHQDTPAIKIKIRIHRCKFLNAENKYELSSSFETILENDRKKIIQFCYAAQSEKLSGQKHLN